MISYNSEKVYNSNKWQDNSIYVLTDFDRTITSPKSHLSWDILSNNTLVSREYINEVKKLYNKYRPVELDETLDINIKSKYMVEWWNEEIKLFIKFGISEEIINSASKNMDLMSFRDGAKDFLINMKNRNIPVIFISAGIGNFIEKFLDYNNCYFDNIYVLSNFLKFENGLAVGFNGNIIHTLNKNVVSLPSNIKDLIKLRNNIILLGDSIGDVKMAKKSDRNNALKIGFLEEKINENMIYFKNEFDVVCSDNTSLNTLSNLVKVLKR